MDSGESSSEHEDGNSSSNDEKAPKQTKRPAQPNSTKTTKAPRSLADIQVEYKTKKPLQSLAPISSDQSTRQSPVPTTTSLSGSSQDYIPAPQNGDAWDDVVMQFQEVIEDYRHAVMTPDDKDAEAFGNLEKSLKDIGLTLSKRRGRHDSNEQVQAKCQQFLQYVATYCQHHNQAEMHAFFENLLSQRNEGPSIYLLMFYIHNFSQVKSQ